MFKLLIVDDDNTSRDSLIRNITRMNLGISQIEKADDGLNALEIAQWYHPEVILTDVRMPRMDGIEMSRRIKETNPDIEIIFLSGYSDKEYLKSAIDLRALSYVEKPVDYDELENVLRKAIDIIVTAQKMREHADIHDRMVKNFPLLRNEIAIKIINPINNSKEQFDYTLLGIQPDWDFITIILQLIPNERVTPFGLSLALENAESKLNHILASEKLTGLTAIKDKEYILLHIAGIPDKSPSLLEGNLKKLLNNLQDDLINIDYFIAAGKLVRGINNVPESYNTALVTLQRSFYKGYGTILFFKETSMTPYVFQEELIRDFNHLALNEEYERLETLITDLSDDLSHNENTLINQTKGFYYRLLLQLYDLADELNLENFNEKNERGSLLEDINEFHTLLEVKEYSIKKIKFFSQCRREKRDSKSKIVQIIKFIESNYMSNELSIKMISEHTFLSVTYMCSIFKQETNNTINQYLTDYRIEKAKDLLKNRNYNVSEIAENVGFSDGQYFAKTFKKKTGFTPSEFREKY